MNHGDGVTSARLPPPSGEGGPFELKWLESGSSHSTMQLHLWFGFAGGERRTALEVWNMEGGFAGLRYG